MNLNEYDLVVINSSAGKDSQTMLRHVVALADEQGYDRSKLVVVHADLGKVEWKGTKALAERQAAHYGLRFIAIARPQGDLLTHIRQRGMWPSSTTRYCTSDHKRGQVQKVITQLDRELRAQGVSHVRILNAMGFRAQESPARAKRVQFTNNARLSTQSRTVDDWLPIHEMLEDEVWADIKESGVEYHPAYDVGMPRLSCVFCVFAPKAALVVAGIHNPELLDEYVEAEAEMGHVFRKDCSMADVKAAIERGEHSDEIIKGWEM